MKDFMFIFRGGSSAANLSPKEMQDNMQQWFAWIDQFKSKNIYVGGEPLLPQGKTVSGSSAVVTDGPFAESKELVGGYIVVKADSLEAATELAKGCPDLQLNGSVEVREVMKFDGM
ncbi:MAG TPA: YciI family protein [Chitinophaga sp.]|jgi:hypothetical protein|uniref:YciI family protein n=1 Tax=Chitinophaga sp. TaxID=1869181 RepID=UPI002DBD475C|nr:YciI family protein [Chitinophaga sp.]HEU4554090.1 YciI family protein [Chitinophaga sp.]